MLMGIVLHRMWQERRLMVVLLVAVLFITSFMALGPLYVREVAKSEFVIRLDNLDVTSFRVDLIDKIPIQPQMEAVIKENLVDMAQEVIPFTAAEGVTCGFFYTPNAPNGIGSSTDFSMCYRPSAYQQMDLLFTLVEGRFPVPTDEQPYEIVVTQAALDLSREFLSSLDYEIGDRFIIGDSGDRTITVEIVGIVTPNFAPDDPIWDGNEQIFGVIVPVNSDRDRVNASLLFNFDSYAQQTTSAVASSQYYWRFGIDPEWVTVDTLNDVDKRIQNFQTASQQIHPESIVRTKLLDVINDFQKSVTDTERPIVLLSTVILVLLLYNLVTIVTLILEQQSSEWAVFSNRGGSVSQLIRLQFYTVSIICVIAAILGPFVALLILAVLSVIGPQSAILNIPSLTLPARNTFILSIASGLAASVFLTIPALPLAQNSLLKLKQSVSRPPAAPSWARYFLDFILMVVGAAFILRLYTLIAGDAGGSLLSLLRNPSNLTRTIAESSTKNLTDPFNLLGPVLLLSGAALLWIRLFPYLMRLLGFIFQRLNDLTVRLALWNVERDPGHYAQLVLLIIGTLALGTASLSLSKTLEQGAWGLALEETGADAVVTLNPISTEATTQWQALPEVHAAAPLFITAWASIAPNPPNTIIGIDADSISRLYPELADELTPLTEINGEYTAGSPLPEDTQSISLEVYVEPDPDGQIITTDLIITFYDAIGVPISMEMLTEDTTRTEAFIKYTVALDASLARPPLRFASLKFRVSSQDNKQFNETLYLDNLTAHTTNGEAILLDSFEPDTLALWKWTEHSNQVGESLTLSNNTEYFTEGSNSLRIWQRINPTAANLPTLQFNPDDGSAIPVLISPAFAKIYGARNRLGRPLEAGDEVRTAFNVLPSSGALPGVTLSYRVMGIVDAIEGFDKDTPFLLAQANLLLPIMNQSSTQSHYYNWNQVRLDMNERTPPEGFESTLNSLPGVTRTAFAWDRFNEIQREPLTNAITGVLFAGFWTSLGLILLDFAFYMAVTTKRRAISFAVLRSIGWDASNIWRLLTIEQAAFITPALFVGVLLGAIIAYLILPFMRIIGGNVLEVPIISVLILLVILLGSFSVILGFTAVRLRQQESSQTLRTFE